MRYEKHCCICGKKITAQFWVCKACEQEYGLAYENGKQKPRKEWPEWAQAMYNEAQNDRYRTVIKKEGTALELDDETNKEKRQGYAGIDEFDDSDYR